MQCSSKIAILATVAAPLVGAQSLSNLPPCAQNPAIASISSTGCALTDIACICSASAFLSSLQPVIEKSCSAEDLTNALAFAKTLCASTGITLSISAPAASTTSAPMSTDAAAETTSAAEAATTTAAETDTAASESMTEATMTTSTMATTAAAVSVLGDGQPQVQIGGSNTTSNMTTASSTPVPFTGAAASYGVQFMSGAMLVGAIGVFFTL